MITVVIKGLLFAALLIYAAVTDIKRREVDDWVCVSILIVSLIGSGGSFWGAVITALPFFIPAFVKGGSIGGGDVKLMFACGAVLDVWGGLGQTVIAFSFVAVFSLVILTKKGLKACKKTAIPLAPFLCAGGIASYIITNMHGGI
jgi:leader peptidase (prepilin peptidase)/N-methyltransferase